MNRLVPIAMIIAFFLPMSAQDVPTAELVKFIRLLMTSTGEKGFGCGSNMGLRFKLEAMGVSTVPTSKLVWASTEAEVKTMKAAKRFVVVPKLEWLKVGAAAAIVQEEGKPVMHLQMANVKASGLTLPDAVIKAAKAH